MDKDIKQFREKFSSASFTWNGDNSLGISFAKKTRKSVEDFWLMKLKEQREDILKKIGEKFDILIAKEIVIAFKEDQPTSRLTSLAVKFTNLIKSDI